MLGRTHALTGALIGLVLLQLFSGPFFVKLLAFFLTILGSLLPDIDERHSIIGRKIQLVGVLFKHRGFFHSFIALGIFAIPLFILFENLLPLLGFVLGFVSHLFLDMLTKEGLFIYPFSIKIRGSIKVGGFLEKVLFILLFLLLLYALFSTVIF